MAGPDGRAWFVFIGHGAPSLDGADGLLVGVDAPQDAETLPTRTVSREELLQLLVADGADVVAILDTCLSGMPEGESLVPGLQPLVPTYTLATPPGSITVATAAASDQFAGALPGETRPAFSYLLLGAAQGWGDADTMAPCPCLRR